MRVKLGSTTIIVLAGGQILKQTFDGAIYRLESDKVESFINRLKNYTISR